MRVVIFMAIVLCTACASHTAPPGYLPEPKNAQTDAHGGWIDLLMRVPAGTVSVRGELIALAAPDSLWLLTDTGAQAVALSDVAGGQLVAWDSQYDRLGGATLLGTLTTLSNGFLLVFTAPLWIIVGSTAAATQSRLPIRRLPPEDWTALTPFSRFPQGLPPGIDLRELQPKR